jgi:hypothetical protein
MEDNRGQIADINVHFFTPEKGERKTLSPFSFQEYNKFEIVQVNSSIVV